MSSAPGVPGRGPRVAREGMDLERLLQRRILQHGASCDRRASRVARCVPVAFDAVAAGPRLAQEPGQSLPEVRDHEVEVVCIPPVRRSFSRSRRCSSSPRAPLQSRPSPSAPSTTGTHPSRRPRPSAGPEADPRHHRHLGRDPGRVRHPRRGRVLRLRFGDHRGGRSQAARRRRPVLHAAGPLAGRSMHLVGHADPRGPSEYNMALGQRRADSVDGYIDRRGVQRVADRDDLARRARRNRSRRVRVGT